MVVARNRCERPLSRHCFATHCRAADVLNILVQSRCNTVASGRFMRELLKRWGLPRVVVTDKLRSSPAVKVKIASCLERHRYKGINIRRTHRTGIPADARRSWAGSSHRDRPSGSCRSTIRPPPSSARAAIASPQIPAVTQDRTRSTYGHTPQRTMRPVPLATTARASIQNNLTIPFADRPSFIHQDASFRHPVVQVDREGTASKKSGR